MPSNAVRGKLLTMTIEGDPIGESRTITLHFTQAQIDVTSRDSDLWGDYLSGRKEWSVDFEGLYIYNDIAQKVFRSHVVDDSPTEVDVVITMPDNAYFTGTAILTSFDYVSDPEGALTLSGTLQGRGALAASTS